MATYRQIWSYHEDGYGTTTLMFVVAAAYEDLFDLSAAIDVDVFDVESSKKDLEIAEGILAEDELSFTLYEQSAITSDDEDAIAFCLDAQDSTDPSKRRFVALFIQPADTDAPAVSEMEFSGIIRSDMRASDILWHDAQWGTAPTPRREWRLTARPYFEGAFEEISMYDLIYGAGDVLDPVATGYVKGITSAWEAQYVADRCGYFRSVQTGSTALRETRWGAIVPLSDLLQMLADNLCETLDARGLGSFTIDIEQSPLDVTFSPARFRWGQKGSTISRFVWGNGDTTNPPYQVDAADAVSCDLGDTLIDRQLYVSYFKVKPTWLPVVPDDPQSKYGFEQLESFVHLLYAVAANFGVFLRITFPTAAEMKVSFVARGAIAKGSTFVRDVTAAELETTPSSEDGDSFAGDTFTLATEGENEYYWEPRIWGESKKTKNDRTRSRDNLIQFTISPTLRKVVNGNGDGINYSPGTGLPSYQKIPHNARFYNDGALWNEGDPRYDAIGMTTALHVLCDVATEKVTTGGTSIIAPVAAVHAVIDGEDLTFRAMSEYLNRVFQRDRVYFETEYTLDVPYLCSFRKSADGTHADDDGGRGRWQNLQLGSEITIDGVTYITVGIERSFRDPGTKIRLHDTSRFAFTASTGAGSVIAASTIDDEESNAVSVAEVMHGLECGEPIDAGDIVSIAADGCLYRSLARDTHYDRVLGIAESAGLAGEVISVRTSGVATHAGYSFSPGAPLYLRSSTIGTPNISESRLLARTSSENYVFPIGRAISATSVQIMTGTHYYLYPPHE